MVVCVLPANDAANILLGPIVLLSLLDEPLDKVKAHQVGDLDRSLFIPHSGFFLASGVQEREKEVSLIVLLAEQSSHQRSTEKRSQPKG